MPIEFVCKIKFAEEDEKQKNKQDGDKESLIEESCTPPVKDLARFANSCSLHGINHIFVSGRLGIRQTLWALAFLTSLVLFLYQAAKCAISYLEHPHVTALNEEATPEMVFPAVTICNINRFRFSALTDADIYHLANLTGLPPKNKDGHKPTDLMYPAPDMQDIFNRTGHQLEEMLMSCNFSGQNCSVEDFSVMTESDIYLPSGSATHPLTAYTHSHLAKPPAFPLVESEECKSVKVTGYLDQLRHHQPPIIYLGPAHEAWICPLYSVFEITTGSVACPPPTTQLKPFVGPVGRGSVPMILRCCCKFNPHTLTFNKGAHMLLTKAFPEMLLLGGARTALCLILAAQRHDHHTIGQKNNPGDREAPCWDFLKRPGSLVPSAILQGMSRSSLVFQMDLRHHYRAAPQVVSFTRTNMEMEVVSVQSHGMLNRISSI
ncbi:hypothetical protein FQN60_001509 [Etheostoma spectabile]|uniref:Acid-sensing ion channel 4 n=1 Tax=Etheostoma spectabile TaxID=54343 RepID=A0A5J5D6U5_9PERO|nr:hypothetical protein FQN60_001509 [Etheostoma spectabile]